jgi:tripartite-type tricarboxylate transporter receptor subunit TctC
VARGRRGRRLAVAEVVNALHPGWATDQCITGKMREPPNPLTLLIMNLLKTLLPLALLCAAAPGHAAFPDRPIKIIVGFPAGGPLDTHGRLLADKLQAVLGQPIIIDYKAGAGGAVRAEFVARSPADGYTLMLANTGVMVINPAIYLKLSYSTLQDAPRSNRWH